LWELLLFKHDFPYTLTFRLSNATSVNQTIGFSLSNNTSSALNPGNTPRTSTALHPSLQNQTDNRGTLIHDKVDIPSTDGDTYFNQTLTSDGLLKFNYNNNMLFTFKYFNATNPIQIYINNELLGTWSGNVLTDINKILLLLKNNTSLTLEIIRLPLLNITENTINTFGRTTSPKILGNGLAEATYGPGTSKGFNDTWTKWVLTNVTVLFLFLLVEL
jgi:hypothetical protein